MLFALLLIISFASAFVVQPPVVPEAAAAAIDSTLLTYSYAIDLPNYLPQATFDCLKNYGYAAAFIRSFNPSGDGTYDPNATLNVKNAYEAGLATEVYMAPQPKSSKSAAAQMNETIDGLTNNGIHVRSIWIQITSPVTWKCGDSYGNWNFINQLVNTAMLRGLNVGIYTSAYDWQQITGNVYLSTPLPLWYWNINGYNRQSSPNFDDFYSFSSFSQQMLTAKQYSQMSTYACSISVNSNVYRTSASSFGKVGNDEKIKGPIVGFIGVD